MPVSFNKRKISSLEVFSKRHIPDSLATVLPYHIIIIIYKKQRMDSSETTNKQTNKQTKTTKYTKLTKQTNSTKKGQKQKQTNKTTKKDKNKKPRGHIARLSHIGYFFPI
jgi:hypothetical protein